MLTWPPAVRVFVSLAPTDMRRSFDGLACLTRDVIQADPLSGHLFVFFNRQRDRVKILWWDRSGYALWYKRLEQGHFRIDPVGSGSQMRTEMEAAELALVLEGIDLAGARRRPRFVPARSGQAAEMP